MRSCTRQLSGEQLGDFWDLHLRAFFPTFQSRALISSGQSYFFFFRSFHFRFKLLWQLVIWLCKHVNSSDKKCTFYTPLIDTVSWLIKSFNREGKPEETEMRTPFLHLWRHNKCWLPDFLWVFLWYLESFILFWFPSFPLSHSFTGWELSPSHSSSLVVVFFIPIEPCLPHSPTCCKQESFSSC